MIKINPKIILFAIILLLGFFVIPLIIKKSNKPFIQEPLILVTGDFNNEESFGNIVLKGINREFEIDNKYKKFSIEKYSFNEFIESDLSSGFINERIAALNTKIRRNLIKLIAHKNIIAIIAANTSETITPVLKAAKEFNIPVFITVATNYSVIDGFENIAFRLVPNDKKQALLITHWCKNILQNENEKLKVGVLYSPTIYGKDLRDTLRNELGLNNLIPFAIGTTTDIAGSLKYGVDAGVNIWIALTYKNEAIEIAVKKSLLQVSGPIIFSDGAYGSWLFHEISDSLYFTFPFVKTNNRNKVNKQVVGYDNFGADALKIISNAYYEFINNNVYDSKDDYFKIITNSSFPEIQSNYIFKNGENINSEFIIYKCDKNGNIEATKYKI